MKIANKQGKMIVENLSNKRFGRLVVKERLDKRKWGCVVWLCQCDCGKTKEADSHSLIQGRIKSCGCLRKEILKTSGFKNKKHGDTPRNKKTARLYFTWRNMINRCINPNVKDYKTYGARGIRVCLQWFTYSVFKKWALSSGYTDSLTIDRIDNGGNYCPENCRWITRKENLKKRWKEVGYAHC